MTLVHFLKKLPSHHALVSDSHKAESAKLVAAAYHACSVLHYQYVATLHVGNVQPVNKATPTAQIQIARKQ